MGVEVGSPPRRPPSPPPLLVYAHVAPTQPLSPQPTQDTGRVDVSGQESELLCPVRGECLRSVPCSGTSPAVGLSVPALMPAVSLLSLS